MKTKIKNVRQNKCKVKIFNGSKGRTVKKEILMM